MPFVVDVEEALKPESPLVYEVDVDQKEDGGDVGGATHGLKTSGNVRGPSTSSFFGGPRGDLEKGFVERFCAADDDPVVAKKKPSHRCNNADSPDELHVVAYLEIPGSCFVFCHGFSISRHVDVRQG